MKLYWRFGIVAGLFLALFSLYPQMKMLYLRGSDWNGNYAYNDIDEAAYAGYVQALIDGRPRKNDPFTGRDDSPDSPQMESLFSIQFAAPYTIAIPARILGIGAPWAMTVSGAAAAFLTALAIFWLLGMITGDSLYAGVGTLVVLAGGALFAGEGAIGEILGTSYSYPYFPGFRRYIPAMAFPAFFLLVALMWKLLTEPANDGADKTGRRPTSVAIVIVLSIAAFAYTVFSYFYVWTSALAWLGCLGLLLLVFHPTGFRRDIRRLALIATGAAATLVPYAYLLSRRSQTMDDVQMLVRTRAPDLTRMPELIGFVVAGFIVLAVLAGWLALRDRSTLFALSLAITPAILFNQQIVTGQSLQPIHYQVFVGNYIAGLAAVAAAGLIWTRVKIRHNGGPRAALAAIGIVAAIWGFVECHYTVRVLDEVNVIRDEFYPVGRRLTALASADPQKYRRNVLALGIAEADEIPTIAPQAVLWARHQHVFAGVTWQENKERYYQQLYYEGVTPEELADRMKTGDFVSTIALFGWSRHTSRLNSQYRPLTFGEIDAEAGAFREYARTFDARSTGAVRLDYLVAPSDGFYADAITRWYKLDEGETIGKYKLYRLEPK